MDVALLDLGFLENHVLTRYWVIFAEFELFRLGAGILFRDVKYPVSALLTSLTSTELGLAMSVLPSKCGSSLLTRT